MADHTPGPWLLHNDAPMLVKSSHKAICAMKNTHCDDNIANARLIAAAPLLLNVLRRCIDSQESNGYIGNQTMQEAYQAIYEATGTHE